MLATMWEGGVPVQLKEVGFACTHSHRAWNAESQWPIVRDAASETSSSIACWQASWIFMLHTPPSCPSDERRLFGPGFSAMLVANQLQQP